MFLSHSLNQLGTSPKTRPTTATSSHDMCSVKCRRGDHAVQPHVHARATRPALPSVMGRARASFTRPSASLVVSGSLSTRSLALQPHAEVAAIVDRARSPWPTSWSFPTATVPGLRAFPVRAVNARALTVARRTLAPLPSPNPRRRLLPHRHDRGCACGRATSGYLRLNRAVPWMRVVPPVLALPFSSARRRRRSPAEDGRGHSRLLTWPGGHGPPLVALRPASGVPRRRGPRRPLPRRRQTLASRHRAFLAILLCLLCKSRPGASYDNSTKIKGLTEKSVTHVNSTVRTGL